MSGIELLEQSLSDFPRSMVLTISISVLAVLLLAGFVLHMWRTQEKSALIAHEVQRITDSIGAGIVNFIAEGDGHIVYASKGFYEMLGYTKEEIKEQFDNRFYDLLESKYGEYLRTVEAGPNLKLNEEMQIMTKNGPKWVHITGSCNQRKGRIATVSSVIVDISQEKMLNERLMIEQERYRLATELSNDIIFNYDIESDILKLSDNFKNYYNEKTVIERFAADKVWNNGIIHSDDTEKFAEAYRILTNMGENVDQQFRIKDINGNYIWCRLIAMTVRDAAGTDREIIGKLINIDVHKRELSRLETKAMRDPLTGAYNKEYTKALINSYINENPDVPGMLLMVDIDKFKDINDNYGHIMGDNIIIDVVRQVTAAFRADDIVGRIGGDEFVVFVKNVRCLEDQLTQARKLHDVLRRPSRFGETVINKSASIGVALCPEHSTSYNGLIECADKALYEVKGSGRDSFKIFSK